VGRGYNECMELCLNTLMWHDRPLPEALEAARATRITCLEIGATFAHPHLNLLEGRDPAGALRPLLEGWRVAAVTADHPDLSRAEDEGGDEAVAYTIAAVHAAHALGAGVVSTSLGSTQIDAWETAWVRAVSGLRQVLGRTSRTRVRVAVELNAEDVMNSLRKARRLLAEIEDPRLGLTLDTSLLHYLGIPLREALSAAGERVYHVHLRDAARGDYYRSIGRGEVSFPAAFRALREHGYDGALSIELYRTQERHGISVEEALAESVPRLREWLSGSA
jgi:sugar phosphate isomerase/epimerase